HSRAARRFGRVARLHARVRAQRQRRGGRFADAAVTRRGCMDAHWVRFSAPSRRIGRQSGALKRTLWRATQLVGGRVYSSTLTVRSGPADVSAAPLLWLADSFFISGSSANASTVPPTARRPSSLNSFV